MTVDTALIVRLRDQDGPNLWQIAEQVGMNVPGFAMTTRIFRATVREFSLAMWS
jgi:hypothetical protein